MKDRTRNFLLKWFNRLDRRNILRLLSDKTYVKIIYRLKFNKKLNLKDPKTFNEKLQWLKLYNRKPEYSKMVDKYEVKKLVADKIPCVLVAGLIDRLVPYCENGELFVKKYEELGGTIKTILKPDCDHHPHSLDDPTPISEFIIVHK